MTSVGKGRAGGPAKGLAPAHFFPLEGTVCMLWGTCIYSDQPAFIAILSIDKELFLYSTTRIQFRRHECTN